MKTNWSKVLIMLAISGFYADVAIAATIKDDGTTVDTSHKSDNQSDYHPTGRGWGELDTSHRPAGLLRSQRGNLTYQGGPVMAGPKNVYYIWYGTWDIASKNVLTNLGTTIGGSPYFNINSTYYDKTGAHVQNSVTYAGTATDNSSLGTSLSDANIQTIVTNQINSGALPLDPNGIYFVLTDKNTKETSGFCTKYCGWHTHAMINNTDIKYAFIGDGETQCAYGCGVNTPSPNNTPGADAMASIIAHELEEATTDPDLNAWYALSNGYENGDKCAWNFGATRTASNGSSYNQTFGALNYLIQQNWSLLPIQGCMQHYP